MRRDPHRKQDKMTAKKSIWLALLAASAVAVSATGCFLFPPALKYQAVLEPAAAGQQADAATAEGEYVVHDDGSITWELPGLRLRVRSIPDDELNARFVDESSRGKYSVNPYTYGDWVDPRLGYTPNRFTIFEVTVNNRTFPKVMLSPLAATLQTDRGEFLRAYGITSSSPYNNFENYYRSRRGQSGNEFYRFELRMGMVRSHNYEEDQPIFKGENYKGFVVFDPVHEETERVSLLLNDFVLRFGAFDRPVETRTLQLDFDHHVKREAVERLAAAGPAQDAMIVGEDGPTQLLGNLPGDRTRDASAIRATVQQRLRGINDCFTQEFDQGAATEGRVVTRFTVEVGGAVSAAGIDESTVGSNAVGDCIEAEILRWTFRPIDVQAMRAGAATGASSGGTGYATAPQVRPIPVTVTYPFEFEVGD